MKRFAVAAAALILAASIVLVVTASANDSATVQRGASVAVEPYNGLGRWTVDDPMLCLVDQTDGYPVAEAVSEFDGIVNMKVLEGCDDSWHRIDVVTTDEAEFTALFSPERNDGGQFVGGTIVLNLGRDYRMSMDMWRIALVHELGHATGLYHTHKADSVMDPGMGKYWSTDGLTDEDRRQLAAIYG